MQTLERIDSPNPAVRAIERWKRGATVAILAALGLLPGALAAVVAAYVGGWLGGDAFASVAGVIAFLAVAPWGLGQRSLVRQIGRLASLADD